MAQTKTNVLPIGQTFSSPPTMRLFGLFDYGPKFQTEALPSAPRTSRHLCGRLKCGKPSTAMVGEPPLRNLWLS